MQQLALCEDKRTNRQLSPRSDRAERISMAEATNGNPTETRQVLNMIYIYVVVEAEYAAEAQDVIKQ